MARNAFISYASEDEPTADKIGAHLERSGVSCWIASRDVRPGADYASEIIDGIETSAVLVLVLSEHANSSEFVKREVERAVSKGKPVFPVRVREVVPSKSLELFISSAEWIDAWHPPIEQYLDRLAQSIRTYLFGAGAKSPADVNPASLAPKRDIKRPVIAILGLAVIVLSVLLGRMVLRGPAASPPPASGATPASPPPAAASPTAATPPPGGGIAQGSAPAAVVAGAGATGPCPHSLSVNPDLPTPFSCTCSAEAATQPAAVWGTDVYTDDSALCRAALHAGVITLAGGAITIVRSGGRPLYVGSARNGVSSNDYASFQRSIEFKGTPPPPPGPGLCPHALGISRELPTPFTCRCTADVMLSGAVWGTDVYTEDSAMCRAALHAGRIPLTGGTITAMRAEGLALYVGTTRNGVHSNDYGAFASSLTFR